MLRSLALAFAASAASAAETAAGGKKTTQRIAAFLPFTDEYGNLFGRRQLAIVAAMAVEDWNARNGHLPRRRADPARLAGATAKRRRVGVFPIALWVYNNACFLDPCG